MATSNAIESSGDNCNPAPGIGKGEGVASAEGEGDGKRSCMVCARSSDWGAASITITSASGCVDTSNAGGLRLRTAEDSSAAARLGTAVTLLLLLLLALMGGLTDWASGSSSSTGPRLKEPPPLPLLLPLPLPFPPPAPPPGPGPLLALLSSTDVSGGELERSAILRPAALTVLFVFPLRWYCCECAADAVDDEREEGEGTDQLIAELEGGEADGGVAV